ncbi:MAG: BACON domain-containing protein [Prolixibacteraceae bacterium]|jgi:hypothetical protein|nr:BACON domain-containing protein [Prolixibacteraceae bacterium]
MKKYPLLISALLFTAQLFAQTNPTTNIEITATCIQTDPTANFEIVNNNLFTLDIDYVSGETFQGKINLEPGVIFQLYVYKNSMVNFYYNNSIFITLLTNNVLCGDPQQAYGKIHAYGLGRLNSIYFFSVVNRNNFPVTVTGDAVNVVDSFTVPANGQVRIISDIGDLVLACNGTTFSLPVANGNYGIEESAFISVTPVCMDATTATFVIQNNDGNPHDAILRNASGVEHRYTLAAYANSTVVVENCNWDIYLAVSGLVNLSTQMIGDHFKVGSVSPANAQLTVSENAIEINKDPYSQTITVASNTTWTASSNQPWLTLNKATGTGNDEFVFSASANTSGTMRTATITLTAGCTVRMVTMEH